MTDLIDPLDNWGRDFRARHEGDTEIAAAYQTLQSAGCDLRSIDLWLLLIGAARQSGVKTRRHHVADLIQLLDEASTLMRQIGRGEQVDILDPEESWRSLGLKMSHYANLLQSRIGDVVGHGRHRTNSEIAKFSEYVRQKTGRYHDRSVKALATAAAGLDADHPIAVDKIRERYGEQKQQ